MKRRDLEPGTFFRYACNPRNLYWVPREGVPAPLNACASGPSSESRDWDLEVEIVEHFDLGVTSGDGGGSYEAGGTGGDR